MERSEPTLVPEWLRSTGSVAGVATQPTILLHHLPTQMFLHAPPERDFVRIQMITKAHDLHFLDRTSSSNSRRNSISNGFKHDKESDARE